MRADRLSPARRAASPRGWSRARLLAAQVLLAVSLNPDVAAAQTPASADSFPTPLAPPKRSAEAVTPKPAVDAKAVGQKADEKDASQSRTGSPAESSPSTGASAPAQPARVARLAEPAAEDSAGAPNASEPARPTPKATATPPAAPPASIRDAIRALPVGAGRAHYRAIIEKETARTGLPADIAEAVMAVESGFNPAVIGAAGEIGLMQLMPPTARMLGFSGSLSDLAQPEVNIHYGVTYLSQAWRLAGGDLCTAVMKYRAGHAETRFSQLSVNYCLAVRSKLAARGYPVTGSVPVATFGELTRPFIRTSIGGGRIGGGPFAGPPRLSLQGSPPPCRSRCLAEVGGGRLNFNQINDSLNHLVLQSNIRAIRIR